MLTKNIVWIIIWIAICEHVSMEFRDTYVDTCMEVLCVPDLRNICARDPNSGRIRTFQGSCELAEHNNCDEIGDTYEEVHNSECNLIWYYCRTGCGPKRHTTVPVCGKDLASGKTRLFANDCTRNLYNCKNQLLQEIYFHQVSMELCTVFLAT